MTKKILLLPGDGIGTEVVRGARKILEFLSKNTDHKFELKEGLIGGSAYDKTGTPFPDETLKSAKESDAILLGAVGGEKWDTLPYDKRPERALLGIRKELGLFANLRPAIVFDELVDASSLKPELVSSLDIMIIRELTGDLYFGQPRGIEVASDGTRRGYNTLNYYDYEVARIAKVAFDIALTRGKKLCSVDKANVLESNMMWREEVIKVSSGYKNVELSHMYVDNAAMQLVRNPKQFDVIVTTNMFGDILSDIASMLTGSLGMLPSASLGEVQKNGKQNALYEPVHGSAPDIAGKNIANPIATILSVAMMMKYSFGYESLSQVIENSVKNVLRAGYRSRDIAALGAKIVSTTEMGDLILSEISKNFK